MKLSTALVYVVGAFIAVVSVLAILTSASAGGFVGVVVGAAIFSLGMKLDR